MNLWQLLKDILLTGTGMGLMVSQVFSARPSDVILVTGLALTVPAVAGHAGALLSAGRREPTGGHSSAASPPGGVPPSGSLPGGTDE